MEKRLYNNGYHLEWISKKDPIKSEPRNLKLSLGGVEEVSIISLNTNTYPTIAQKQDCSSEYSLVPDVSIQGRAMLDQPWIASNAATPMLNDMQVPAEKKSVFISKLEITPKNKRLAKKMQKHANDTQLLLIILAFFLPPLAVYLYEGNNWTSRCTLNLVLTILCGIPGIIHALIIILGGR